jgi:hypothetical protein
VTATKPWPSYLARDYNKPGHFKLTEKEATLIRKTLALAEPCQRAFLRYAFPSNGNLHMVLYLENLHGNPHVLWTNNIYYQQLTGELNTLPGAEPEWNGIQYDVTKCPSPVSRPHCAALATCRQWLGV